MGLRIDGSMVVVDHDNHDHLRTTKAGNPTLTEIDGISVHCVFQRLKNSAKFSQDRSKKTIGDNCPLVYALKGKDGLRTNVTAIKLLFDDFDHIAQEICAKIHGNFDCIVPVPSSFPLADCLANRLARRTGMPVYKSVFRKSKNHEAYGPIEPVFSMNPMSFDREDAKQLRNALKRMKKTPNEDYTAKYVGVGVRRHFDPLQIANNNIPAGQRPLLVDDLLATGETLVSAKKLLLNGGGAEPSMAVTWFSNV
ncbi:adenine phosphoribosyltransferase [Phaeobacter inhibens]|uniref:Adenine phosphoribosyltransferase n=2 Tax=Phaeobacter inhibens TaxID=221822 RepID=A0A2I7KDZ0_9RHOB|nr:adenine phosphoribosyltransferase [Phaeobacter inhibens]